MYKKTLITSCYFLMAAAAGLALTGSVFAQPDCQFVKKAHDHYTFGEIGQAAELLGSVDEISVDAQCNARRHQLLGAIQFLAYMDGDVSALSPADRHFKSALIFDPFFEMTPSDYPPTMIRSRYDYVRSQTQNREVAFGEGSGVTIDAALIASTENSIKSFLAGLMSVESFQSILASSEIASAMLDQELAPLTRTLDENKGAAGYKVNSASMIDKAALLKKANSLGILFDAPKPAVRLELKETIDGKPSESRIASTMIKSSLREAGFIVIDETQENREAQILIRGHVDASSERIASAGTIGFVGFGANATADITMTWADGSDYEFGTAVISEDGKAANGRREASRLALESVSSAVSESVKATATEQWNDRQVNGSIYLVELEAPTLSYEDFRLMLQQISTFALNDPMENPQFDAANGTRIYVRYRPGEGDLAEAIREQGFFNLAEDYETRITAVAFNRIRIAVGESL